jgi:hypothetical protein
MKRHWQIWRQFQPTADGARQTLAQTIEQQVERLTAHIHAQDETLCPEYIFRDDGYSGATLNRPGLDRLRDRVKEGMIDRVLMASPDRLARNYVHQMVLLEEFAQAGCSVEFLDQPLGPSEQLTAQQARTERAKLRAEDRAWRRQFETILRRQRELMARQSELDLEIKRAHVEPLIGEFVTITNPGKEAEQLRPKAGDIGCLRKVDRKWTLIDFGDELRTWYIPLWAVGDVKDPFADDRANADAN